MKRNTCFIAAIMFAMVLLTASGVFASEQNYYVTENGAGNYDGGSWANALKGTELAARLQKAQAGDIFYVAKGTYKPGTKNSDSFTLKKGVKLYGGFVGNEAVDELSVAGRNFRTNETVLSGKVDNSTNSKTVIKTGDSCDSSSLIDGFTISDGQNNSSFGANGGGMEIKGSPTVKNCLIKDNSAKGNGGGVLVASSIGTPVIEFCTFKSNTANNGGGVYVSDGEAKISNCTFESNTAKKDDWSTGGYGGGVYAGKKVRIVNCTFCGNDSDVSGNGFYNGSDFSSIMSSTFYRRAGNAKTELFSSKSITVTNSIFWSDEDDSIIDGNGNRTVSYCVIKGGHAGEGNQIGDPNLSKELADNEGRTQTLAITTITSSAINNGTDVDAPERDQRGMSRESSPDIGAYEYIKPNEPAVPDDPAPKAYKKSSGCNTGGSVGFWGFLAVLALPIVRAGVIGRKK